MKSLCPLCEWKAAPAAICHSGRQSLVIREWSSTMLIHWIYQIYFHIYTYLLLQREGRHPKQRNDCKEIQCQRSLHLVKNSSFQSATLQNPTRPHNTERPGVRWTWAQVQPWQASKIWRIWAGSNILVSASEERATAGTPFREMIGPKHVSLAPLCG